MSTETKSEYILLFRGTDWHKGLSPEEIQEVVRQMYAWLDRLTAEGKAKAGKPLFPEGKIVSKRKAVPSRTARLPNPKKRSVASSYSRWVASKRLQKSPRIFQV